MYESVCFCSVSVSPLKDLVLDEDRQTHFTFRPLEKEYHSEIGVCGVVYVISAFNNLEDGCPLLGITVSVSIYL